MSLSSSLSFSFYRSRDWIAFVPAAIVLGMLISLSLKKLIEATQKEDPPISVMLLEDVPQEIPPPPVPEPPRLQTQPQEMQPPVQRAPLPDTRPIPAEALAEPVRPPVQAAPPQPEKRVEPPPASATPAPPRPAANPESEYTGKLVSYLNGIKRYPTSREARLQRPTGVVRIWVDILRDGTFKDAGVETSSDSMILDNAALSTVRQGRYPAFPVEAWEGKAAHRFVVNLEYKLDG